MNSVAWSVALVAVLIVITGVFAAAEMALVTLRESQVKQLATRGKRGATLARLVSNPNRFLSAVSVGITLSGFLSAAFGAANLEHLAAGPLERLGMAAGPASVVGLIIVTLVISYFSVVFGELTAKRLAMQRAEAFALALAPMIDMLATLARPVIWFLDLSTNLAVRVFGGDPKAAREQVTDEEIRSLVVGAKGFGDEERQIVEELFDAGERSLREVMVPRTEVDFLPGDMLAYQAIREVQGAPHSRYPVTGGTVDEIVGFLHVRDLMDLDPVTRNAHVSTLVRPVTALPETVKVLHALTEMRRTNAHLAIVRDEYGGTAGIVTLEDLVEELIGEIQDEYDIVSQPIISSTDSIDVDGLLNLEEFADRTGLELPDGPYDTIAGYWVAQHGNLPQVGDSIEADLTSSRGSEGSPTVPVVMTIKELDGRRAARVTVRRRDGVITQPVSLDPVERATEE